MTIRAKYNESFVQHETIIPTFLNEFQKKFLFQSTLSGSNILISYKIIIYRHLHRTLYFNLF
jgi:hypothetical protein